MYLTAAVLLFAAGVSSARAAACEDRASWCGGYKSYCERDDNVRQQCRKLCGLCGDTGGTGSKPAAGCGGGSAAHPPSLRFDGDRVVGVAQGISGGYEANANSYPFAAQLGGPWGDQAGAATCTASIIGDEWVLTAAHCVAKDNQQLKMSASGYWVRVGNHNRRDGKKVMAKNVIVHHSYYGGCKRAGTDIALVQLAKKLTFDDKTQAICLPDAGDDFTDGSVEKMVAAGWGLTTEGQSGLTEALQHAVFTTGGKCYRNSSREMCAWAGKGSAACSGDSGGPLFFKRGGKWTQAGIAECGGGKYCAQEYMPSTYVHVPAHRDWIRQKTGL